MEKSQLNMGAAHQRQSACSKYFDFIGVRACTPINALCWGLDSTQPIQLVPPSGGSGSAINFSWVVPLLDTPASGQGDFYTHIHVSTSTVGNGTFDSDTYAMDHFMNPNDPEAPGATPAGIGSDLTKSGFPTDFEIWSTNNGVDHGTGDYYENQENCPGPIIHSDATSFSITQFWPASQPGLVIDPGPEWPLTTTTTYSGKRLWSDVKAGVQAMLDSVPLITGSTVGGCREGGSFTFAYIGTVAGSPMHSLPGKTYDASGNCVITGLAANTLLAVQLGANDGGLYSSAFFQPTYGGSISNVGSDLAWGNNWPWNWPTAGNPHSGGASEAVSATWASGGQIHPDYTDGQSFPDTCNFVTASGSVIFHAGSANAGLPVTALVGPAIFNRITIFPLRSGMILTVQYHNGIFPASYQPVGAYAQSLPGLVMSKSRIRIPIKAAEVTSDVTYFSDICTGSTFLPPLNMVSNVVFSFSPVTWTIQELTVMPTGEYVFEPADVGGVGYLSFGDWTTVNLSPKSATQGGAGDGGAGGQSSDPNLI